VITIESPAQRAYSLLGAGRAADALALTTPFASRANADSAILDAHAAALKALNRHADALEFNARATRAGPTNSVAWHNYAATLGDLERWPEALAAVNRALATGLNAPETTTQPLLYSEDPAIKAFFRAIDAPIRDYMAAIGTGDDPLRSRNTGAYRIKGAWSVRLRASDYHIDHIHPQGWLSSAFYVETPTAVERDRQGWLGFGRPIFRTRPALEPERWVRPEPGRLVLFPSYLWHGTAPFSSDETRLSLAFDVVPA